MPHTETDDPAIQKHLHRSGVDSTFIYPFTGDWPCTIVWTSNTTQTRTDILPSHLFNLFIPTSDITLQELTGKLGRRDFKYSLGKIGFAPSQEARTLELIGKLEGYTFFFNPKVIAKASKVCFNEDFEHLTWRTGKADSAPAIAYLGLDIAGQISTGLLAGHAHVDGQIQTFLSMVLRRYSSTRNRDTALIGIFSPVVLKVVNFVDLHLSYPITLEFISSKCGASISHLGRLFRDEMGSSVWSYVQRRRLSVAADLLTTSDYMIGQIGQQCGYPDPKHFSRQFKSYYTMSPAKYRLTSKMQLNIEGKKHNFSLLNSPDSQS